MEEYVNTITGEKVPDFRKRVKDLVDSYHHYEYKAGDTVLGWNKYYGMFIPYIVIEVNDDGTLITISGTKIKEKIILRSYVPFNYETKWISQVATSSRKVPAYWKKYVLFLAWLIFCFVLGIIAGKLITLVV